MSGMPRGVITAGVVVIPPEVVAAAISRTLCGCGSRRYCILAS